MEFFAVCVEFAKMDVLDAGDKFQETFDFQPTQAFNDQFMHYGIESMNFLLNSGSIFPIVVISIAIKLLGFLISRIMLPCSSNKACRKIGSYTYESNTLKKTKNQLMKLFLEAIFDLTFCVQL